jgi:hypothetical protein
VYWCSGSLTVVRSMLLSARGKCWVSGVSWVSVLEQLFQQNQHLSVCVLSCQRCALLYSMCHICTGAIVAHLVCKPWPLLFSMLGGSDAQWDARPSLQPQTNQANRDGKMLRRA